MIKFKIIALLLLVTLSGCAKKEETKNLETKYEDFKMSAFYYSIDVERYCAQKLIDNPDTRFLGVRKTSDEGYISMVDIPTKISPKPTDVNIQLSSNCMASGTITIEGNTFDIIKDLIR